MGKYRVAISPAQSPTTTSSVSIIVLGLHCISCSFLKLAFYPRSSNLVTEENGMLINGS
jgi:hypothetical protein